MEVLAMNMQSNQSVAIALGHREMELTAEALSHIEDIKRTSFFYLRGLDGIIRALTQAGRGPCEDIAPERCLELLDIASEKKSHIEAIAAIDMYVDGRRVETDLPSYDS